MDTTQIEKEKLLNAALQMPRAELEQFVARLFALKARQEMPNLTVGESDLLTAINKGLSAPTRRRMKELIAKRQSCSIDEDELQELIGLTDEAERLNVERIKHLIKLASLRGVTLDELMDRLGVRPQPYE